MDVDRLAALQDLPLSYPHVGATGTALPDGYSHFGRNEVIGSGRAAFHAAAACLIGWDMHRGAGFRVAASGLRAEPGVNVLLTLSVAKATIEAPCRVIHVAEEHDRVGFTYGTLKGHPVQGEESFNVVLDGDQVRFVVIAFSRPSGLLVRMSGPIGRTAQRIMLDRYQRAVESAAADA